MLPFLRIQHRLPPTLKSRINRRRAAVDMVAKLPLDRGVTDKARLLGKLKTEAVKDLLVAYVCVCVLLSLLFGGGSWK